MWRRGGYRTRGAHSRVALTASSGGRAPFPRRIARVNRAPDTEGGGAAAPQRDIGMRQFGRCAVLVVAGLATTAPAMAQFGGIFGAPPRPPGSIPNQQPYDQQRTYEPAPPTRPRYQPQDEPQYQPPPQYPPPQTNAAPYIGPPG